MKPVCFLILCLACRLCTHAQALYTTTLHGGLFGGGTICKLENNKLSAAFNFPTPDGSWPAGKLMQAPNGTLYGMTQDGGKYNVGTIFSFDPATKHYSRLIDFDTINGAYPTGSLLWTGDGRLYGVTIAGGRKHGRGVIFSYHIKTKIFTNHTELVDTVDEDDALTPFGSLVKAKNGKLYGMSKYGGINSAGTIFSYDPDNNFFKKVVDFNDQIGSYPVGNLLPASDGKLYGATEFGGKKGNGVLFNFNPSTGVYTSFEIPAKQSGFQLSSGLTQAKTGILYGIMRDDESLIFSFNPKSAEFKIAHVFDSAGGLYPHGSLLPATDGKMYGVGYAPTELSNKVIFSFDPATGKQTIENFKGSGEGKIAFSNIIQTANGKFFGLSLAGELFVFDTYTSVYTTLRNFKANTNGYAPRGPLASDSTGVLYGTTSGGGKWGKGIIFSFNPAKGLYKKLWDFVENKNNFDARKLLYANNGILYGVDPGGGINRDGTLFSLNTNTGAFTIVWQFTDSTTGSEPGELIQATDGKLYGSTTSGGANWKGVLFCYMPATNTYIKLHDFADSTGSRSYDGRLLLLSAAKLYGMTFTGGMYGTGVLFSYDLNQHVFKNLVDSFYLFGTGFSRGLVQVGNHNLYGFTQSGGENNNGVLFSYNTATGVFSKLYSFPPTEADLDNAGYEGDKPVSPLAVGADGKLYGIWERKPVDLNLGIFPGEDYENGGVYSFDPTTAIYTKLQLFTNITGLHPQDTYFISAPSQKRNTTIATSVR